MKKKIITAVLVLAALAALAAVCYVVFKLTEPADYVPADDEIALHVQLNLKEDIGLLVFDYSANGAEHGGGMSNADKSPISRDSDCIQVWNRQELGVTTDTVELAIRFRIITEYISPNFENSYPAEITVYVNPVTLETRLGESCYVTITGDRTNGYKAEVTGEQA